MLQIGDILVSLDIAERYFCCDLDACHGACCIEGDAGAPLTEAEAEELRRIYPKIRHRLNPGAVREVDTEGVAYTDEEGDLVTTIVNGADCAFTCYAPGGLCQCAIERAHAEGECAMRKPISCYLYPIRETRYPSFTALNYHRWDICRGAEKLGRRLGIRVYQFLKEPLIERFGREWYDELAETCEAWNAQNDKPQNR